MTTNTEHTIRVSDVQATVEKRDDAHYNPDRHEDACLFCGKGLTAAALDRGWWVHVIDGGTYLARNDGEDFDAAADLGWFPVGSECAKRVPADFRQRFND